jgi:A/G-specific adenine glycosylase
MDLHAYWARIEKGRPRAIDCDGVAWATIEEISEYPLPRADIRILERLRDTPPPRF